MALYKGLSLLLIISTVFFPSLTNGRSSFTYILLSIYMVSYAVNIRHQALVELALPESHHVEVSTMRFLRRWESNPI